MSIKPILFNTEMVRAILEGCKTVTRRVVKPKPEKGAHSPYECVGCRFAFRIGERACTNQYNPPYHPGNILYVRETWAPNIEGGYFYRADGVDDVFGGWHPSIHMPWEAARIFLRVTDVRVERLQSMLPCDIQKEGCPYIYSGFDEEQAPDWYGWMKNIWNSTINPADRAIYGWDANPWVWVIEFERCEKPEGL